MSLAIYFFISLMINLVFVLFNIFFFKNNWLDFIAKFRHNSILCYFISDSGNMKKELHGPKNDKFERKGATYLVDKEKRFFNYPSKTPIYFYTERHTEPLSFTEVEKKLNPEFLDNLLLMAKASGSIDWINKLIKFKWIILSFIVMAVGILYLVWKMNELQVDINELNAVASSMKSAAANLAG